MDVAQWKNVDLVACIWDHRFNAQPHSPLANQQKSLVDLHVSGEETADIESCAQLMNDCETNLNLIIFTELTL